jgi:hypothetical protein
MEVPDRLVNSIESVLEADIAFYKLHATTTQQFRTRDAAMKALRKLRKIKEECITKQGSS